MLTVGVEKHVGSRSRSDTCTPARMEQRYVRHPLTVKTRVRLPLRVPSRSRVAYR